VAKAEGSLEYPPNCCIGGSTRVVSFVVKAVAIGSTAAAAVAVNQIEKETHPMVVELVATDFEGVAFADYWVDSQAPVE
jgi:hypothetical protein